MAAPDAVGSLVVDYHVTLDIPAKAEYVLIGRLALAGLLRSCGGYSDDAIADLKLALTEACSNSVRHACDSVQSQVHLAFTLLGDRVTVEIHDDNGGFHEDDVDCPECRDLPGMAHASGGLGISIIRAVVDDVDLRRPNGGGTVLVLTKLRDA
jgi:serine/threonine-protein kinase RsbW